MIGVGRHLDRELAAGRKRRGPPGEHARMIGHPLQAGVGEHQVVPVARRAAGRGVGAPCADVAELEPHAGAGVRHGVGEHRRRVVDADHVIDPEPFGGLRGQRTVAAPEVDGAGDRSVGRDQADQVPERLRPLGGELAVLRRVPVSSGLNRCHTCILLVSNL